MGTYKFFHTIDFFFFDAGFFIVPSKGVTQDWAFDLVVSQSKT